MSKIRKIIIHCADTPADMDIGAAEIDRWHKERGWDSMGYHWVIRRDGTLEEGRSESTPGAHAYGHNQDSIGVCMVGGKPDCNYTSAQWAALDALVNDLIRRHPDAEVLGHKHWIDNMILWLYKHYAITGLISVYYMALIGYGTAQVFYDIGAITAPAASAYLTLMGLPAGAAGLIKWRLSRDNPEVIIQKLYK